MSDLSTHHNRRALVVSAKKQSARQKCRARMGAAGSGPA